VRYTLDGSEPTKGNINSSIACDGWRADECTEQWREGYTLRLYGSNMLRAVVLKQGYHEDACLEIGENVSAFAADSAARVCNNDVVQLNQQVSHLFDVYPVIPMADVSLNKNGTTLSDASYGVRLSAETRCKCEVENCCSDLNTASSNYGSVSVRLLHGGGTFLSTFSACHDYQEPRQSNETNTTGTNGINNTNNATTFACQDFRMQQLSSETNTTGTNATNNATTIKANNSNTTNSNSTSSSEAVEAYLMARAEEEAAAAAKAAAGEASAAAESLEMHKWLTRNAARKF
jgi:hypothetical protein